MPRKVKAKPQSLLDGDDEEETGIAEEGLDIKINHGFAKRFEASTLVACMHACSSSCDLGAANAAGFLLPL